MIKPWDGPKAVRSFDDSYWGWCKKLLFMNNIRSEILTWLDIFHNSNVLNFHNLHILFQTRIIF